MKFTLPLIALAASGALAQNDTFIIEKRVPRGHHGPFKHGHHHFGPYHHQNTTDPTGSGTAYPTGSGTAYPTGSGIAYPTGSGSGYVYPTGSGSGYVYPTGSLYSTGSAIVYRRLATPAPETTTLATSTIEAKSAGDQYSVPAGAGLGSASDLPTDTSHEGNNGNYVSPISLSPEQAAATNGVHGKKVNNAAAAGGKEGVMALGGLAGAALAAVLVL